YFSMDKVGATMPTGMNVLSLEGSSSTLEIPLKIRYNVIQKKKSNIFSSAGITSYVLINEKNNYLTQLNGTKQNILSSYKKSSGYFAAAINLSLGYEYKTGKKSSIRVEPYAQIPLKGIGVGALPVMSAGVHVGFTLSPH
ncbi:MAG: hypothetical protein ABI861_08010, partial [Panacibacter sp.]